MTNATVGSWVKSVGKSANRRFEEVAAVVPFGTLAKLIQGTCFRAYRPAVSPVNPMDGRSSAYPLNVFPRAISCCPRLLAVNG